MSKIRRRRKALLQVGLYRRVPVPPGKRFLIRLVVALVIFSSGCTAAVSAVVGVRGQVGTPITSYWAGPGFAGDSLNDITAQQIADGGFTLAWSREDTLDIAQRHGLRVQIGEGGSLGDAEVMNDPAKIAVLDAFILRVKRHPALYSYHIIDEPNASKFPALGALIKHFHEKDPAHPAIIGLFPTYASNAQLGTTGDTITAYREYLRRFMEQVKPSILSYNHYHFYANGTDGNQYFLNLALIREYALAAGIPFANTVQSCSGGEMGGYRAPNVNEMRWLNYTSLAYGAQWLSYFVYYYGAFYADAMARGVDPGGMMKPDGSTTAPYAAARELNPQFIKIASQLQPLRFLGAYHVGTVPWGAVALPGDAPFHLDFSGDGMSPLPTEGMLLGCFGNATAPTHVLVVNLNYNSAVTTTVVGPDQLFLFDAVARKWTRAVGSRVAVTLPPGGGKLIRVQR